VESSSIQACTKSQNESPRRIVTYAPHDLRPHPSYARHRLSVPACKLSVLRERDELAFVEPLAITHERTIIDDYARWELAKGTGRPSLHCIEYDLSETEALQWLLHRHGRSNGLNAFTRIMLALDLEASLTEKARSNQRNGGEQKGWSKLTEAERLNVRTEIATAAGVSAGNVTKVKNLLAAAHPDLLEALHANEISIHRAWTWSKLAPREQQQALWRHCTGKGVGKTIRTLVARHQVRTISSSIDTRTLASRLAAIDHDDSLIVTVVKSPGKGIFLTEELFHLLGFEQMTPCNTVIR